MSLRSKLSARVQFSAMLTLESDSLLDRVNLLSLGLVHLNLSLLVSSDVSGGLDDTSRLERSDGDRGQERREEEVVSRGDDDDVELFRVEVLEERGSSPSGTKDHKGGLGRVAVELLSRVDVLLGHCDLSNVSPSIAQAPGTGRFAEGVNPRTSDKRRQNVP